MMSEFLPYSEHSFSNYIMEDLITALIKKLFPRTPYSEG
jgi:hypothetical protein